MAADEIDVVVAITAGDVVAVRALIDDYLARRPLRYRADELVRLLTAAVAVAGAVADASAQALNRAVGVSLFTPTSLLETAAATARRMTLTVVSQACDDPA